MFQPEKTIWEFYCQNLQWFSPCSFIDPIQDGLSQDRSGMGGVEKTPSLKSVTRSKNK